MGTIIFNNISSVDLGVVVQTPPVYHFPARRLNTIQIQGRNGDIMIDKNAYNNVVREYSLASAIKSNETFVDIARKIVDWLSEPKGYVELEDTYEPGYFRLALFRDGGGLPNFYDQATAINIRFDCKPQRFLKTGKDFLFTGEADNIIPADTWFKIENENKYIALPLFDISGDDVTIEMKMGDDLEPSGEIISSIAISGTTLNAKIDSDLQDCYDSTEFLNNRATLVNEFPKLYPGYNWIKVSAGATVKIKPRWWVL